MTTLWPPVPRSARARRESGFRGLGDLSLSELWSSAESIVPANPHSNRDRWGGSTPTSLSLFFWPPAGPPFGWTHQETRDQKSPVIQSIEVSPPPAPGGTEQSGERQRVGPGGKRRVSPNLLEQPQSLHYIANPQICISNVLTSFLAVNT